MATETAAETAAETGSAFIRLVIATNTGTLAPTIVSGCDAFAVFLETPVHRRKDGRKKGRETRIIKFSLEE